MSIFKKFSAKMTDKTADVSRANHSKGFTLLEILIAISVIATLSAVVILVVNPSEVLKKSRDAQRISDLASLKSALDAYLGSVESADLDNSVSNFCLAPSNTSARISYSYKTNSVSSCTADVAEGTGATTGSTFSTGATGNFCYNAVSSLQNDFTIVVNPISGGAWRFGWKVAHTSSSMTTFPNSGVSACGPATLNYWNEPAVGNGSQIFKNVSDFTTACSGVTALPGAVAMHPGSNGQYATSRWTAPVSGTYTIIGRFYSITNETTDVHIVHGTTSIFDGIVNNGANANTPFSLTRTVAAGETIDVTVGYGGNGWSFDNTGVDATISSVNVNAVDASGWLPVNLTSMTGGSPVTSLPVDPVNTIATTTAPASTDYVYRYACQGLTTDTKSPNVYELNAVLESAAFTQTDNKMEKDGGDNSSYYEVGSELRLIGTGTNF